MPELRAKTLEGALIAALDAWRRAHPEATIMDALRALEEIRFKLTEILIEAEQRR
jgi:hypothetical protein